MKISGRTIFYFNLELPLSYAEYLLFEEFQFETYITSFLIKR